MPTVNSSSNPIEDLARKLFVLETRQPSDLLDRTAWSAFVASGLDRAMCSGEPTSLADAVVALRTAGRAAVQLPIAEAMLARFIAHEAGWDDEALLPTILTATDTWGSVPWGRYADVVYTIGDGRIDRYRAPFVMLSEHCNVANEPRDELRQPTAPTESKACSLSVADVLSRAALAKAALMVGAMEAALDIVIDHANQRVQFDRPIAQFQAVQQMLANIAAHTAAAGAAVDLAAAEGSVLTAAIAKARASEAVGVVTDAAHQVAGAMGFTVEFPLHRLTRRLWAWRDECGNERYWNRRIGEAIGREVGNQGLWRLVSSNEALAGVTVKVEDGI